MTNLRPQSAMREDQFFISSIIESEPAKLIVAPMGRGKTGATLNALKNLLDKGEAKRILVVAPLRVAESTWPDEIETWAHTVNISYAVCVGSVGARKYALAKRAQITIINRENLVWVAREIGSASKWPWDTLVVDESSMFKAGKKRTAKTKRKRPDGTVVTSSGGKMTRFGVLAAARKMIKRVVLLTGTPGGLEDLWGQVYLLDQGKRLGEKQSDFLARWFTTNPYTRAVEPRATAHDEIMALIADLMISLPPLKLVPDPVFIPVKVKLSDETMREYKRFARTLVSDIHDVEAVNQGVLTNKLLQFSNGSMYREDGSIAAVHTEKLDALDDLIERAQGDPVMVFYGFKFDLEQIRKRHPDAVVLNESSTAVKDWNDGKIKILLAHPASCAHGLNLQYGGHIAIWFGLTWSLELYLQANARLPRPGQKNVVAIYQILAEGTVDEKVVKALDAKETNQQAIVSAVEAEITGGKPVPQPDYELLFG